MTELGSRPAKLQCFCSCLGQTCLSGPNLQSVHCRANIEAAVRDILGSAATDANQPLMEAGLDSLGMLFKWRS